jgi:hypothetical protein
MKLLRGISILIAVFGLLGVVTAWSLEIADKEAKANLQVMQKQRSVHKRICRLALNSATQSDSGRKLASAQPQSQSGRQCIAGCTLDNGDIDWLCVYCCEHPDPANKNCQ